jgi:hypothetical protein
VKEEGLIVAQTDFFCPLVLILPPPLQHALRRKSTVGGRWLRFLAQTGLWAKLTEAQGAALLEGCERVAACQVLCGGLIGIGSSSSDNTAGVFPALAELLRGHAMRRWGEDLPVEVRQRLEQGGLPPLDLFLANPSAVAQKLASLQVCSVRMAARAPRGVIFTQHSGPHRSETQDARADFINRTNRGVKEQVEASVALTNVILR